jgi:hypothetical protein
MRTPELDLLRLMVRGDAPAIRLAFADPDTRLAAFLGFAHQHQLGAFVYWKLERLGLTRLLSKSMLAAAKAAWLVEHATSTKLTLELRALVDILDKSSTGVLFIKGPLFAQRFYGSLTHAASRIWTSSSRHRSSWPMSRATCSRPASNVPPAYH